MTNEVVAEMPAKTLEALRGSIAKWEAIAAGTGRDEGTSNCPLCQQFYKRAGCNGCPIAEATDSDSCDGNLPYIEWSDETASTRDQYGFRISATDKAKALAQKEVDFLKSLLPVAPVTALEQDRG
jgi:hypothetical protein